MTSNYTKDQEANLPNIMQLAELMPKKDSLSFIVISLFYSEFLKRFHSIKPFSFQRTTFCGYVSDPYSVSPNFIPHMKLRLLKMYDKTYSGLYRVNLAVSGSSIDIECYFF